MYKKILFVSALFSVQCMFAQDDVLTSFSEGYTPEEVGKRLACHFVDDRHDLYGGRWIHYAEVCTWNGAIRYAVLTEDRKLITRLQDKFEPLFSTEKKLLPAMNHVDLNMFGSLALELYQITKDKRYLDLGIAYADTQWEAPGNAKPEEKAWAEKGYTWQTRLWIDDMYMITILQTQAYNATGDRKYIDRAAKEMVMYLNELQRPNGLFYHAPDVPFYWGRGDGWMAVGMAELLRYLPEEHKDRPRIMEGFRTMMKSLKTYQRPDGMWNQLIDEPDCWAETSGSAMFACAFITGVKQGWLAAGEYAPAARKAWRALVPYIDERNNVTEVCIGTGKKNDKQYYYDRPRLAGDFHGQAPYLWCAVALLEKSSVSVVSPSAQNHEPNVLTENEIQEGWKLLWDGKTTDGWRGARLHTFPEKGWSIKDGILKVHKSGGSESANGGDIVTVKKYTNFIVKVDVKITKGANSGIKYFVDSDLNKGEGSAIGCEFQILDDNNHPDAKLGVKGNRTLGSLYDLIPSKRPPSFTFDMDGFNTAMIIVKDNKVEHWLNGVKLVEYERNNQMFNALVAYSKYKNWPNFGNHSEGNILLQDHGDEVFFKNIKIKELE